MKKIILYSVALLSIVSCKKNIDVIQPAPIVYQYISANYSIKEDFEMGKKAAYAIGDVAIKTGTWSFEDALLGQLTTDVKKDSQSVRLRTGKISMNFDIDSISMIKINHAQFGSDAASVLTLWVSEDQGVTYSQLGNSMATNSKTFITDSFKVTSVKKVLSLIHI